MELNNQFNNIVEVLFNEQDIKTRINELKKEIMYDYASAKEDVLFVSILKGSYIFTSDLTKCVYFNNKKVYIDFMELSTYGSEVTSSGNIILKKDITIDPENKHIIILEDIVDSGNTINWIKDILSCRNPASIKVCCLLDKKCKRNEDLHLDYIGFECSDEFVVGYGMDYAEEYRTLPFVGVLNPKVYNKNDAILEY